VSRYWRYFVLLAVLLLVGLWPAYLGAVWYKTRSFRMACEEARELNDWRTLREMSQHWVDWDPRAGRAWWYAAEAAQELEDIEDLADCLGNVPKTDVKALFAYVEKANLEWTILNRPMEALRTSEQILEIDPRVLEIHSRVISFYAMTMQRAQMLKAIRASLAAGAEPKEAYTYIMMADVLAFTNGDTINTRWLAAAPNEIRFKIGLAIQTAVKVTMNQEALRTEESVQLNREAEQQLKWFLEKQPGDPVLLSYMLHRAYLAGDVNGAAELLLQVDDRSIDDHMIWVYRAWYHTMMEDFEAAEESILEAIRLHPMSPLAHHEYANLLRRLQRPEVADQQRIAAYGKQLRSDIMRIESAADLTLELLIRMQSYADACGDVKISNSIQKRL
jgi:tetratricopeptide (TPR) repeat protein